MDYLRRRGIERDRCRRLVLRRFPPFIRRLTGPMVGSETGAEGAE